MLTEILTPHPLIYPHLRDKDLSETTAEENRRETGIKPGWRQVKAGRIGESKSLAE